MKTLIMTVLMLVTSVAFAKEAPVPIDADCNKMATNARSFALLKQTGVATTTEQFASFIVSPTVQTYPIRSILNYVFENTEKSPDEIYTALYGRCVQMGYKDLLSYFTEREAYAALKIAYAEQGLKLANAEHDKAILASQVSQLKELMATTAATANKHRANYIEDTTPLVIHASH